MGVGQWMRVLDTVNGLVQMSGRFRRPPGGEELASGPAQGGPLGLLEARLAGVVVAALKEAFDRDRARMDLEQSHMEAERQRAEQALRAELRRQAADRAHGQLRLIAIMAAGVWMLSAALGVWLPRMQNALPLSLMATGWALAIGALGCAFTAWQRVSRWSAADTQAAVQADPANPMASAALWLLLASLALTGASLLAAL